MTLQYATYSGVARKQFLESSFSHARWNQLRTGLGGGQTALPAQPRAGSRAESSPSGSPRLPKCHLRRLHGEKGGGKANCTTAPEKQLRRRKPSPPPCKIIIIRIQHPLCKAEPVTSSAFCTNALSANIYIDVKFIHRYIDIF